MGTKKHRSHSTKRAADEHAPFPPALSVPPAARAIHDDIVAVLRAMLRRGDTDPLCAAFRHDMRRVLDLFERYQREVVFHAGLRSVCSAGCRYCCCHWPEDIYSFEGEIAAEVIAARYPERMRKIAATFREDEREMERLDEIVSAKMQEPEVRAQLTEDDQVELLLASYYRLGRACALLNPDGSCAIYDVRPLSCRIYLNFSDPHYCIPEHVDETDVRTYLLDMEEDASTLLDVLHERFERHRGITGLRPLLARLLEERTAETEDTVRADWPARLPAGLDGV